MLASEKPHEPDWQEHADNQVHEEERMNHNPANRRLTIVEKRQFTVAW